MMTEDQAKTKWCPHVRYHNNGEVASVYCNKPGDPDSLVGLELCIASDCMMWVVVMQLDVKAEPRGHCGLVK